MQFTLLLYTLFSSCIQTTVSCSQGQCNYKGNPVLDPVKIQKKQHLTTLTTGDIFLLAPLFFVSAYKFPTKPNR